MDAGRGGRISAMNAWKRYRRRVHYRMEIAVEIAEEGKGMEMAEQARGRPRKDRFDSTAFQALILQSVNDYNDRRRVEGLLPRFLKSDGTISLTAVARAVSEVLPDDPMSDGTLYRSWDGTSQPEPATLLKLARLFGPSDGPWLEAGGYIRTPRGFQSQPAPGTPGYVANHIKMMAETMGYNRAQLDYILDTARVILEEGRRGREGGD